MVKKGNQDFQKVKTKVGQKKRNPNETIVSVKSRRLVIRQDTENMGSVNLVQATQSELSDLLSQLKHYNSGVRKESVLKLKEMLANSPDLLETSLGPILSIFTPLMIDEDSQVRQAFLKVYPSVIAMIREDSILTFKETISVYVNHGLTSINNGIKRTTIQLLEQLLKFSSIASICTPSLINNLIVIAKDTKMDSIQKSTKSNHDVTINNLAMKLLNSILNIYNTQSKNKMNDVQIDSQEAQSVIPIYSIENSKQFINDINGEQQKMTQSQSMEDQLFTSIVSLVQYLSTLFLSYMNQNEPSMNSEKFTYKLVSTSSTKKNVFLELNDLVNLQLYLTLLVSSIKYIYHHQENRTEDISFDSLLQTLQSCYPFKLADKVRNNKQSRIDIFMINSTAYYVMGTIQKQEDSIDESWICYEAIGLLKSELFKQEMNTKVLVSFKFIIAILKSYLEYMKKEQLSSLFEQLYQVIEESHYSSFLISSYFDFMNTIIQSMKSNVPFEIVFHHLVDISRSLIENNMVINQYKQIFSLYTNLLRVTNKELTNQFIHQLILIFWENKDNQCPFHQLTPENQLSILNLCYFVSADSIDVLETIKELKETIPESLQVNYSQIVSMFE